jgi:TetR/AcrR family transcriptional repressor of mexJK operon
MKALQRYEKNLGKMLDAAKFLFLSEGYQNTSMDKVAARAKVTKQTIYRYFPSKAELFKAMLMRLSPKGRDYGFGDGDVREELEAFARSFVALHLTEERLGLFRLIISESPKVRELGKTFFEAAPSARKKSLSKYISETLKTNAPDKDADIFSAMLLYVRNSILMGISPIPDTHWIEAHCSYVTALFLSGRQLR